ncbi:MAG TPA: phage baseplate assembly protein V [Pyrinomonadaceae bacterium]|nr:phage baseplate assembly protein V [Pyrinomonadaceae bacterium]
MSRKFFGKYRGVVTNNKDPLQMGRIIAQVPAVLGPGQTTFALPCVPLGLSKAAGSSLPKVGATVWIEFEHGDRDFPIWSGCFFANSGDTPASLKFK